MFWPSWWGLRVGSLSITEQEGRRFWVSQGQVLVLSWISAPGCFVLPGAQQSRA